MMPKNKHHIIAIALYVVFATVAVVFKKAIFLILLVLTHSCEYIFIGRNVAAEKNIRQAKAAVCTLLYGFTWWKPIKEGTADWDYSR